MRHTLRSQFAKTLTILAAGALTAGPCLGQDTPTPVGLDKEVTIGGVDIACSGIGQEKSDPRWLAYPTRVEFSNPKQEYLSDGAVTVANAKGERLASVSCEGPWILLRPTTPGSYSIEGWIPGTGTKPQHGAFHSPGAGQVRLVLRFPDA
jgi:hypothetical protein